MAPDRRPKPPLCSFRAHLGHLGHPIANDALYGGPYPGPERPRLAAHGGGEGVAAGGAGVAVAGEELVVAGDVPAWVQTAVAECAWCADSGVASGLAPVPSAALLPQPPLPPPDAACAVALEVCPFCPGLARPASRRDVLPLWLHARAYTGPGWAFACPPPAWAAPDFVPKREGG